jgi:hypothetical protein
MLEATMRLSQEQIKRGILHPERLARDVALRYFTNSFSDDPTVMPLAIQAVETYGWEEAFLFHTLAGIAQTEDTLLWVIDQLNRQGRPEGEEANAHCIRLSDIVSQADVSLLMRHEQAVLGLEGLFAEQREVIAQRLRMMTLDTEALWGELEQFCQDAQDKHYSNEVNLDHAFHLAEAIARDGDTADRVLSILSKKLERTENNPMGWMQVAAARIAGDMHLAEAAPLLAARLMDDSGDMMSAECELAFAKIGGEATVEAIVAAFGAAPRHFKIYASPAFEHIHCDSVVPESLELLKSETDPTIRENLVAALLGNFCSDGIEPARQMALRGSRELRWILVGVATLMDMPFPELREWNKEEQQDGERLKRHLEEFAAAPAPRPQTPAFDNVVYPEPAQPIVAKDKVGRNAPCPCGSGKKYKKCCGK